MPELAIADIVGSIGVAMLLGAFGLNLYGGLSREHGLYIVLNLVGAGLAALASYLIEYLPFVILEGMWFLVSLGALIKNGRNAWQRQQRY